jgi:hypothetical protein
MQQRQDVLAYARQQADELEKDMAWQQREPGYNGYWQAPDQSIASRIAARAVAALEFFRRTPESPVPGRSGRSSCIRTRATTSRQSQAAADPGYPDRRHAVTSAS